MSEERLERIENHIVQLIQMVAQNNKAVLGLEQRFDGLEQRFDGLEQRFDGLEQRVASESEANRLRHLEVMGQLRNANADVDYLRNQVSKHDMELHKIREK